MNHTMKKEYVGILLFGHNTEFAGRGIAGARLRTAAAKENYNIMTIDYVNFLSVDRLFDILGKLITTNTKFLGFSSSWVSVATMHLYPWYTQEFFNKVREQWPDIKIITGGHDEFRKDFLLKNSDFHFHGYSDNSFVEFLKMIHGYKHTLEYKRTLFGKGGYIDSNLQYPINDPDTLETVFYKEDGFESHHPLPIEIARGCIFRCGFCRHPFQGKKDYDSYQRTPESIARELKRNYDLFGTTRYTVLDDTFNDSIEKILHLKKTIKLTKLPKFEFVAYIKAELLVTKPEMIPLLNEIGLRGTFIGFESFHPKARQSVGKGTKIEKVMDACKKLVEYNNGQVLIHGSFIVGLPHETPEDLENTFNFLISEENTFIKSWHFEALSVRNIENVSDELSQDQLSTFDKTSNELGYSFDGSAVNWKNKDWNWITARSVAENLIDRSRYLIGPAGWKVAGMWQAGYSDDQMNNLLVTAELVNRLNEQTRLRANAEYNRIMGDL